MRVALVCGARPNFMKIAPLMRAIGKHNASSKMARQRRGLWGYYYRDIKEIILCQKFATKVA